MSVKGLYLASLNDQHAIFTSSDMTPQVILSFFTCKLRHACQVSPHCHLHHNFDITEKILTNPNFLGLISLDTPKVSAVITGECLNQVHVCWISSFPKHYPAKQLCVDPLFPTSNPGHNIGHIYHSSECEHAWCKLCYTNIRSCLSLGN